MIDELGRRRSKRSETVLSLALVRYSSLREAECVHAASAHSKAGLTEEQVLDTVARALRSPTTRMLATEALICAGEAAIPALLKELRRTDEHHPQSILHALQHLGPRAHGAVPAVRTFMENVKDKAINSEATTTLVALGDTPHIVKPLPDALQSQLGSLPLRRSILAYRLQLLREVSAVRALCKAYPTFKDPQVQATALFVLVDHAWRLPEAADVCVHGAWNHPEAHVRLVALFCALQIPKKKDEYLPAIVEGLSDKSASVRSLCAEHIGIGWNVSKATMEQLTRVLDHEDTVARRVVGALIKKQRAKALPALAPMWDHGSYPRGIARAAGWCGDEGLKLLRQWINDPKAAKRIAAAHGLGVLVHDGRIAGAKDVLFARVRTEDDPLVKDALVAAMWGHIGQ